MHLKTLTQQLKCFRKNLDIFLLDKSQSGDRMKSKGIIVIKTLYVKAANSQPVGAKMLLRFLPINSLHVPDISNL